MPLPPPNPAPGTAELLALAVEAAERAAAFLRQLPRPAGPASWDTKGPSNFVTEADRNAETLVAEALLAAAPGSAVVGEEHAPALRTDGLVWVVDPLDGTTNYLHGYPAWSVSVAGAMDGVLQVGVVVDGATGARYSASRGGGAWCDGRRLAVSGIDQPAFALVGTGFPYTRFDGLPAYLATLGRVIRATSGVRRNGSAALDLAQVAAGRLDGFWEQRLSAWDTAAGILLIREAGGLVTDDGGRDLGVEHGPVVAGNPAIHRWLLEVLAEERP